MHECDIIVDNGKLVKSECTEEHQFKPFSNEGNGAVSLINQASF